MLCQQHLRPACPSRPSPQFLPVFDSCIATASSSVPVPVKWRREASF